MTSKVNSAKSLSAYVKKGLFYKTVVEQGSDIIIIVDYNGLIIYCNNSVKATLGYSPNELVNKSFFDFLEPSILERVKEDFHKSTKNQYTASIEFQFRSKDKSYKFFEFNAINLKKKDKLDGLLLDCRDISQRKKDSEELVRAQKAKELFLANISHEIRTPINGIAGMADLLSHNPSEDDRLLYLKAIKSSAENLKVIINDILDISSIESGKLKFEKINFNLEDLLRSLVNTFRLQANEKGIELKYEMSSDVPPVFVGDPVRLNQILINLVGNALKFTHQGFIHITVSLQKVKSKEFHLKFGIQDTGIGIPNTKIKKIFESFSQADASVTRKYGGTGLGLTIVKQLVELQRGSIKVESIENQGSTFTFILPYSLGKIESLSAISKVHLASNEIIKSSSVLLVEDNDINRLYAGSILKMWGCQYDTAENGEVAIQKLKNNFYDLILMDIQMPVMDGFEATKLIRQWNNSKSQTPIIALTANATKKDVEKCIAEGMNDCLTKPFTQEQLLQILHKHLKPKEEQPNNHIANTGVDDTQKATADLSYLEKVSGNNKDFVREIAETIISSIPKSLEEIIWNLKDNNWDELARIAHKIKPSVTLMGMTHLKNKIVLLEEEAKSKKQPKLIAQLAVEVNGQLKDAIETLKTQLSSY